MSLSQSQLSASVETVYLSTGLSAVTGLYLVNCSVSSVTFSVHLIRSGDSASALNTVYFNQTLESNKTVVLFTDRLLMSAGDRISASASVGSVVSATCVYTEL